MWGHLKRRSWMSSPSIFPFSKSMSSASVPEQHPSREQKRSSLLISLSRHPVEAHISSKKDTVWVLIGATSISWSNPKRSCSAYASWHPIEASISSFENIQERHCMDLLDRSNIHLVPESTMPFEYPWRCQSANSDRLSIETEPIASIEHWEKG